MEKLIIPLLLNSIIVFSQQPFNNMAIDFDTIMPKITELKEEIKQKDKLYSNNDLKLIDSLLVQAKFKSPLYDSTQYIIKNHEIIEDGKKIIDTKVLKKRLEKINATTPFHLKYSYPLERVINNYLKYRKKYYPALMARAKYYFPIFEKYLAQYNLPIEMKYLAIVESALHPKAKSRVGATGLWQFMYGTGKQFNLNVNSYIDERQDPIKSTIAACEYLNKLYEIFNDWDLALAAYNSGPGNVLKAIKRSGGHKNYWNIRRYLPMETAGYVPAFYATMYIFKYADKHNLYPEKPKYYEFETDTVQVKQKISFNQIAEKINVSVETISFLNPTYKINIIPYIPEKKFAVRLPRNKIIDFLNKEQEIYELANLHDSKREKPLPKYSETTTSRIRYRVRKGDYLGRIAGKFGVRVSQIKRWNNMKNTKLSIGQRLTIYPRRL